MSSTQRIKIGEAGGGEGEDKRSSAGSVHGQRRQEDRWFGTGSRGGEEEEKGTNLVEQVAEGRQVHLALLPDNLPPHGL